MKYQLVVIGGSAGSLDVLLQVMPDIKENTGMAFIIVLHRKSDRDSALVQLLASRTKMLVKEAEEKEPLLPNVVYIAPADYHLLIENDHTFSLDMSEKLNFSRPSIDITFEAAAEVFNRSAVGILLSGANADGVEGLMDIKKNGGIVAAQDPADAEVSFMPQQAIQHVKIDRVLKDAGIAAFINNLNL